MRNIFVAIAMVVLCCSWTLGQGPAHAAIAEDMLMQQPVPAPDVGGPAGNVMFHREKAGDKVTMSYFAVNEAGKTVTGAPYSATAITETTQVLADGNRIVNRMESQLARDIQGRTRRQEVMNNVGPLAMSAPKMAFINDPVANASYILDLDDKTAEVIGDPAGVHGVGELHAVGKGAGTGAGGSEPGALMVQKKIMIAGGGSPGLGQRVWVNTGGDASAAKTESLGTQTIEGVSATGTRTTRTIPAGEIGNERPLEITSEVWTSTDLQVVVMSKRNDPRIGETVYKLTNIQRAEPDPSLFQVPSGFSINQESGVRTKGE